MSSINVKDDSELKRKKEPLNTTIDGAVLNNFKAACKKTGIPMNVIIETFMNQFTNGEFRLKFGNASVMSVEISEQ